MSVNLSRYRHNRSGQAHAGRRAIANYAAMAAAVGAMVTIVWAVRQLLPFLDSTVKASVLRTYGDSMAGPVVATLLGTMLAAIVRLVWIVRNDRRSMRDTVESRRLRGLAEAAYGAIFHTDHKGAWIFVGGRWHELTGQSAVKALNIGWLDAIVPHMREQTRRSWTSIVAAARPFALEVSGVGPDGSVRQLLIQARPEADQIGAAGGYIGTVTDVTQHRFVENRLESTDDSGGGRQALIEWIEASQRRCREDGRVFALLYLDIDRFKNINAALSYDAGDQLLIDFAHRMAFIAGSKDRVTRVSGDEFLILLDHIAGADEVGPFAQRLLDAMKPAFHYKSDALFMTASIGVVVGDDGSDGAEDIVRDANLAMDQAKKAGGNQFVVFDRAMRTRIADVLRIDTAVRQAFEQRQLEMWYQPVVDLVTGQPVGAEALMRWRHPTRGIVGPNEFLPVAQQSDLMLAMEAWSLDETCRQVRDWIESRTIDSGFWVGVNLSGRQFKDTTLIQTVRDTLKRFDLDPERLKLEITESEIMENIGVAAEIMKTLQAEGGRFSLDDFGTGYSSLKYLRELPIHTLKIDRSFVMDMGRDERQRQLVRAIIDLARIFRLTVVAEGVETEEMRAQLFDLKCDFGQGYLFARPMPATDLAEWLQGWNRSLGQSAEFDTYLGERALISKIN